MEGRAPWWTVRTGDTDSGERLVVAYEKVEFLARMHAGEVIRGPGTIVRMGNSSRTPTWSCGRRSSPGPSLGESAADYLDEAVLVTRTPGSYRGSTGREARAAATRSAGRDR